MSAKSFADGILDERKRLQFAEKYAASKPYRHAVIDGLLNDELLRKARDEIIEELQFTEKETDIYKVSQTGDLANLDGLPQEEAGRLRSLLDVRNALYSKEFRSWLEGVTGCGPLSAAKKDMSINDYTSGCHLLNHDDVISTRRVSFILYLPDPAEPWQPSFGGSLELYPNTNNVPETVPSVIIPPKWNQFTFFAVQPGHSFHAVEEVVHPSKHRLSISGWFHRLQSDEQGFEPAEEEHEEHARKEHASAEALLSKQFDLPFKPFAAEDTEQHLPGTALSDEEKRFLAQYINPSYLQEKTQMVLFETFGDESHVRLQDFLRADFASAIQKALAALDDKDGVRWWHNGKARDRVAPPLHSLGLGDGWKDCGPPHRQRYAQFVEGSSQNGHSTQESGPSEARTLLIQLREMFASAAWRKFLSNISQLIPVTERPVQIRRFRPGLDYTLARSDSHAVLDVTLDLTPDVGRAALSKAGTSAPKGLAGRKRQPAQQNGNASLSRTTAKKIQEAWEIGECGGWENYMAPAEDDDDPAVYGSASKKKDVGVADATAEDDEEPVEIEMLDAADDDEEDDDGGVLLSLTAQFNTLAVVLRDEGVMRFVKYLSASAGGSRFDIAAEYEVGAAVVEEE